MTTQDILHAEQKRDAEQQPQQQERHERVAQIMTIIGTAKISQIEVERAVRFVDGITKMLTKNVGHTRTTKAEKEADKRTGAALCRLALELTKPHRNRFVATFFDLDVIKKCASHCERHAMTKLPKPKRQDGAAKRAAAHEAARLLQLAGLPLNLTHDGNFCQLTAILDCGDARQAKHYQPMCRVVKALRNRV